jgi:hypothetical protein
MKNSIYHSVDDVSVVRGVEKIIDVVIGNPELTWGALIDTAFDYGQDKTRLDFDSVIDCYEFPELQGLNAVAPRLIALFPGYDLRAQVVRLIRHCQGRPMLSFVGTTDSLKAVSASWRATHMVSVVDEQEMLLRFADTRILSYLPQVLTSPQWRAVCGAVSNWIYFNRFGNLVACDIPDLITGPEKVALTKEQLEKFLDASHPDALMALIGESMCDIVPIDRPVSERYRMILDSYELAKKYVVKENSDVLALAVAAYLTKGKSNADQRLESLLQQRAWPVGSLGNAIVDAEIIQDEDR